MRLIDGSGTMATGSADHAERIAHRPISFSAPMVRSIRSDIKKQTRRLPRSQPPAEATAVRVEPYHPMIVDRFGLAHPGPERFGASTIDGEWALPCPFGRPGDHLYVREHWRTVQEADGLSAGKLTPAHRLWFEADGARQPGAGRHRQAMHMPKWASRMLLVVKRVRFQRLQDLDEADAIAEGLVQLQAPGCSALWGVDSWPPNHHGWSADPRRAYAHLWQELHGPASWHENPFVWAIDFAVLSDLPNPP